MGESIEDILEELSASQTLDKKKIAALQKGFRDLRRKEKGWEKKLGTICGSLSVKGEDFFRSIVRNLANLLDFKYALIGKICGEKKDKVVTLAVWANNDFMPNFEYELAGSPCEAVLTDREPCHYPKNVTQLFPQDTLLQDMDVESYFGFPLFGSSNNLLGILVALNDQKVKKLPGDDSIIKIFGSRAGAELEQKLYAEALEESEARYRALFEKAGYGVFIIEIGGDGRGRILNANPVVAQMHGYAPGELTNMDLSKLGDPRPGEEPQWLDQVCNGDWIEIETTHKKKDGSVFPVEIRAGTIEIGDKKYVMAFNLDTSERKRKEAEKKELEKQLFQAQKMESLGRLAGGIAHDFDNMLTSIMGYAEFLKMKHKDLSSSEGKAAEVIFKNAERAATLTKQLLDFSRKDGHYTIVSLDVNHLIRDTVKLIDKIFEEQISVEYDLAPDLHIVEADKNQLHQVLANLVINAKDAMPSGGKIIVKTVNIDLSEGIDLPLHLTPGHYVWISIGDTGIGMTQETVQRIFEPFFTTKGKKGTGLGLTTAYTIVKNHEGHIECHSEPGEGTTFDIYLPASAKNKFAIEGREPTVQDRGNILLIEDKKIAGKIIQGQLADLGYRVSIAGNGTEAARVLKEKSGEIDLIISEIHMVGKDSQDLLRTLKKIKPDVKVILLGSPRQAHRAETTYRRGSGHFLSTPVHPKELARKVHDILQG